MKKVPVDFPIQTPPNPEAVMCYIKMTMKQVPCILAILVLLTSCNFKTAQDYLNEAEKLSEQKKYKEAIELLDKAIKKDNTYLWAYINRGADKSALGDFEGAIEDYNKVLKIDPKNTLALYNIGNNYRRLDDFMAAIEHYNRAFDTKGGQLFYIDYTQNGFIDLSEFDVPGHRIHYERGIAYYNIDSLKSAFDDFNMAIRKNYMTAASYCWLGYIYISSGQTELGCEHFEKSKQLGDKDAEQELMKYCNK